MKNESDFNSIVNKDIKKVLWVLALIISIFLNFNLIGANADPLMKLYNYFKSNNYDVDYPETDSFSLINKHKITIFIVTLNNGFFDMHVDDRKGDDIRLFQLSFEDTISNVEWIDANWIEESLNPDEGCENED